MSAYTNIDLRDMIIYLCHKFKYTPQKKNVIFIHDVSQVNNFGKSDPWGPKLLKSKLSYQAQLQNLHGFFSFFEYICFENIHLILESYS